MSLRDEFLWSNVTSAQLSLERTIEAQSVLNREQVAEFRDSVVSHLEDASTALGEFHEEITSGLSGVSDDLSELAEVERAGFQQVAETIERTAAVLGHGLMEVRWAVERHTEVSRQVLEVLLNSRENESRQVFGQGVMCYNVGDHDDARDCFQEALTIDRTNHFAHQYLGMLAVIREEASEAIEWFERATRYATTDYHRALAFVHLSRTHCGIEDFERAVALARKAVALAPDSARFAYELAHAEAAEGNVPACQAALRKAVLKDELHFTAPLFDAAFKHVRSAVSSTLRELKRERRALVFNQLQRLREAVGEAAARGRLRAILGIRDDADRLFTQVATDNFFQHPASANSASALTQSVSNQ